MKAVLADFESAPIDERLKATLRFLRKVTLTPEQVTIEDAEAVARAGVSDEAAKDALYVAYIFAFHTRMADTLGYEMPKDDYRQVKFVLLKIGYHR